MTKGTPDYLQAVSADGHLMGSTCDWPAGYGAEWQSLMEGQGGTVTRLTHDEYRQRALALPKHGQTITHAEYGEGTVKAVLPELDAVVAKSQRGEFLARPGTFTIGDRLTYTHEGQQMTGTVRGVFPDGQLRVVGDGLNVMHDIPAPAVARDAYTDFLNAKVVEAQPMGFTPADLPEVLKPFQRDLVTWALEQGRAALFAERGLGKALMELTWGHQVAGHTGRPVLILAPLAVTFQLEAEAQKFGLPAMVWDGGALPDAPVVLSNYEKLDALTEAGHIGTFAGVALDESSILKSFMGRTKMALIEAFQGTPYRLAATATPSPNDIVELGNHAEFLGIMEPGEMLTRWFINDTTQAQTFRLKRHGEAEFYHWLSTWARALRLPSDLQESYSDEGYARPAPEYVVHTVQTDHTGAAEEEGRLFRQVSASATSLHRELKLTLDQRAAQVAALVAAESQEPWAIWVHTNQEAEAVCRLIPEATEVRGNMTAAQKEEGLRAFSEGRARVLVTKPSIAGWGMNWQHCARTAVVSLNYSFEELYQVVGRFDRYGQQRPVQVHLVTTDTHQTVLGTLRRKEAEHRAMQDKLIAATRTAARGQSVRLDVGPAHRRTVEGDGYRLFNGDCCEVIKGLDTHSHDFQIFSPPFSNLYSYSPDLRDMGNTDDDQHFFAHFAFLIPELRRTLKPGRLCAVHVKNLPIYASQEGYTALRDFRGDTIRAFLNAPRGEDGSFWSYHSEICIDLDPVREMQRTKADGLLYKNIRENAAKNRQGMAEYVVVFRKWGPGMDETPRVTHDPAEFTLPMWQKYAAPVWYDINRTDVLNAKIARSDDDEKHLAPLQLDVIRRCVTLWTNPGEVVFTPFLGIGSEVYGALQVGRRGEGVELKPEYFTWAERHVSQAAEQAATRLFPLAAGGA
ncbi:DNA methyltransferase [Deinococcus multiflagellatus]|uniref:DNA methyltransferase n=1 Tax=Deinococcus multiflagellatus TaxID=1656887 RepID=A0ABW1ZFT1_9DEIO|nr:DNA methyltransferase [Deinococcus multiflagellatus]MBZ9712219.1 helicase [Deinococcus multiflagellatus]